MLKLATGKDQFKQTNFECTSNRHVDHRSREYSSILEHFWSCRWSHVQSGDEDDNNAPVLGSTEWNHNSSLGRRVKRVIALYRQMCQTCQYPGELVILSSAILNGLSVIPLEPRMDVILNLWLRTLKHRYKSSLMKISKPIEFQEQTVTEESSVERSLLLLRTAY